MSRLDEWLLRAVFAALIGLTAFVLGYDLVERTRIAASAPPTLLPGETPDARPFLPSARPKVAPADEEAPGRAPRAELQKPMVIELVAGGRLEATGAITSGTVERLKAELDRRGDYVKTVVLNSPGGSVQDAVAMGRLIREKRVDTLVEASGHCASSCPLVFAGGVQRVAEKGASIGVHQIFAISQTGAGADTGMAQAQRISAECQRHLIDMGIDPRVWIHAMETPPAELFYFTPDELLTLKLATGSRANSAPVAAAKTPKA